MTLTILNDDRITFFPTYDAAEKIAAANREADDATEYRVEQTARGYFVALYEDGERVGTL